MSAPIAQDPIREITLNAIADGASKGNDAALGYSFFYVLSATHSRFSISINDGPKRRGKLARGHRFPAGFSIEKVRVYNEDGTGIPLDIVIQVGDGEPIDNVFNVAADEIVPVLRSDTPAIVAEAVVTEGALGVVVDTWVKLLDADEFRAEAWIKTDATAGNAFWATSDLGATPGEYFSRDIAATADTGGFLRLKTTSAIWVRIKTAAKSVRALSFQFAI